MTDTEPTQLFSATDLTRIFGIHRSLVTRHTKRHAYLAPQFVCINKGGKPLHLWTDSGVNRWRIYFASENSNPGYSRRPSYSCLAAVNYLGPHSVTWKLWWRSLPDGGTAWYFSTPEGWYTSTDFGTRWEPMGTMMLDGAYRYLAVNVIDAQTHRTWVLNVLRTTDRLRRRIEQRQESETA